MLYKKIDITTDRDIVTLCDEELDAVSAGAATFTYLINASQTGNSNAIGNVTLNITQGQTGQTIRFQGTFSTS
jgi:hypothetical protein